MATKNILTFIFYFLATSKVANLFFKKNFVVIVVSYLFERWKERESFQLLGSLPNSPQQPGLDQMKLNWELPCRWQWATHYSHPRLPPRVCISGKLSWKQGRNSHPCALIWDGMHHPATESHLPLSHLYVSRELSSFLCEAVVSLGVWGGCPLTLLPFHLQWGARTLLLNFATVPFSVKNVLLFA